MKRENVCLIAGVICFVAGIITGIIAKNINNFNFPHWIEDIFAAAFVGFAVTAGIMTALKKETKMED